MAPLGGRRGSARTLAHGMNTRLQFRTRFPFEAGPINQRYELPQLRAPSSCLFITSLAMFCSEMNGGEPADSRYSTQQALFEIGVHRGKRSSHHQKNAFSLQRQTMPWPTTRHHAVPQNTRLTSALHACKSTQPERAVCIDYTCMCVHGPDVACYFIGIRHSRQHQPTHLQNLDSTILYSPFVCVSTACPATHGGASSCTTGEASARAFLARARSFLRVRFSFQDSDLHEGIPSASKTLCLLGMHPIART